ncbi:hypothetical protein DR999_PMT09386 [Platysternon megacephalum]|uniref:Uncharacterized protein n=1 Tax=Platysternon megacephalum TaxID=55544 RepID=A0A4D9ECF0_9SAUR|nr:hypothetical protein DR999_PMT09386 [Platysternon megacephalum]
MHHEKVHTCVCTVLNKWSIACGKSKTVLIIFTHYYDHKKIKVAGQLNGMLSVWHFPTEDAAAMHNIKVFHRWVSFLGDFFCVYKKNIWKSLLLVPLEFKNLPTFLMNPQAC